MATNGWNCATPLRNPYVTDVVYAPFLLPGAFSTSFTHWQLSELFGAHNLAASNASDYSSEVFTAYPLPKGTLICSLRA